MEWMLLASVNVLVDPYVADVDRQQFGHFGDEETAAYTYFIDLLERNMKNNIIM